MQSTLSGDPAIHGINASDSTFKGGAKEPMHSWYPLLEGYSSGFVRSILDNFKPTSECVLDPFSGTGTTVLQSMIMGRKAFYCEVNPVLQLLTRMKIQALCLDDESRKLVSESLRSLSRSYGRHISSGPMDEDLKRTYRSTFGDSRFFSDQTFLKVLRARAAIDELYYEDPLLADLLTIATLASLIPASLLKRAGDLRFRRPDELREIRPLETCVCAKLSEIADDLLRLRTPEQVKVPLLVCEDARNLVRVSQLSLDAVITSPPYVNGTNYFRNTKIELWFLHCLNSSEDLTRLRTKAVTAGINDVQKEKTRSELKIPELKEVVSRLISKAYDRRIPRLVENYFADLNLVFDGISTHMVDRGLLAVDIGDSIFAGVHVPTERILLRLLQEKGFEKKTEVPLRKRHSHDGTPLKQVLLILQKTSTSTVSLITNDLEESIREKWRMFQNSLPHQKYPYSKRNWGHPLHSLCSYEGKMKPSLAHHLVKIFVPVRGRVLDPFAGVGTIPFEAALHGAKAFGFEISPAALYVSAAKIGRPERQACLQVIKSLKEYIDSSKANPEEIKIADSFGFNHKLSDFYHPKTLQEIILARRYFMNNKPSNPSDCLVIASLLHILHGNRPYALSRHSHPITPFAPTGPFDYRPLIPHLLEKVNRSLTLDYPIDFVEGKVFEQDATSWWPSEVDRLDAILTSPPFFDSTRFFMKNWLRLWFSGWEPKDFDEKPKKFIDIRQKSSFAVYTSVFRQARERLKETGVMVIHLGKSRKCDMAEHLSSVASPWFKIADRFEESVVGSESHGMRDKGTVEAHQYLVLT